MHMYHTSTMDSSFALLSVSRSAALLRHSVGEEMKSGPSTRGLYALLYAAQQLEKEIQYYLKYNSSQPRVPAGSPDGGQWTSVGGGANVGAGAGGTFNPVYDGDPDEPIESVYPVEEAIGLLVGGPEAGALRQGLGRSAVETSWTLGKHKSPAKWANQMRKRGWTPEKISDAIRNGKKFRALNKVNPQNTATRYEYNGRSVVRDDKTNEILQVGGDGFGY